MPRKADEGEVASRIGARLVILHSVTLPPRFAPSGLMAARTDGPASGRVLEAAFLGFRQIHADLSLASTPGSLPMLTTRALKESERRELGPATRAGTSVGIAAASRLAECLSPPVVTVKRDQRYGDNAKADSNEYHQLGKHHSTLRAPFRLSRPSRE